MKVDDGTGGAVEAILRDTEEVAGRADFSDDRPTEREMGEYATRVCFNRLEEDCRARRLLEDCLRRFEFMVVVVVVADGLYRVEKYLAEADRCASEEPSWLQ